MTTTQTPRVRYGIGEWYGRPFLGMTALERVARANVGLNRSEEIPPCPFQSGAPPCSKAGGVCSIQRYAESDSGGLRAPVGAPVVVCPKRFEEDHLLLRWLADIVGFSWDETLMAREVPFMESRSTGKPAGKIDLVVARTGTGGLSWYGLEIQAVYFSGSAMASEFESVLISPEAPRFPTRIRRPDWRSSSAKRLMPQLQVKVPTLRRWGVRSWRLRLTAPSSTCWAGQATSRVRTLTTATLSGLCRNWLKMRQAVTAWLRGIGKC